MDSGVAKGNQGGLGSGHGWKETPSWHGAPRGQEGPHHHHGRHAKRGGGDRDRQGGHRQRNGNFHPRKGAPFQDRYSDEERNEDKLKFVEEDFVSVFPDRSAQFRCLVCCTFLRLFSDFFLCTMQPSLNPETTGKPVSQARAVGTPAGVWGMETCLVTDAVTVVYMLCETKVFLGCHTHTNTHHICLNVLCVSSTCSSCSSENPPSAKQTMSKMLVIKKVSKEDPSAPFSAGFASASPLPANGSKVPITGPSVYKNLVPKPATAPTKVLYSWYNRTLKRWCKNNPLVAHEMDEAQENIKFNQLQTNWPKSLIVF